MINLKKKSLFTSNKLQIFMSNKLKTIKIYINNKLKTIKNFLSNIQKIFKCFLKKLKILRSKKKNEKLFNFITIKFNL